MRPGRGATRSAQPEYTQAALNAKKYEAPTFMRARAALRVFSLNPRTGLQQKKRRPNIHAAWLCGRCAAQPPITRSPLQRKKNMRRTNIHAAWDAALRVSSPAESTQSAPPTQNK
jgi:hypothetical protein